MAAFLRGIFLVLSFTIVTSTTKPPCVIELECAECVPDNMPLVQSHRAAGGAVRAASGEAVSLSCGAGGKFAAYPLLGSLAAVCEAGRFRVRHDNALRHLLELGCQENVFEDVLHEVQHCGSPLQGRAYQIQEAHGVRHLATVCFDEDRAVPLRAHTTNAADDRLALPAHAERAAPLSLLGNFNHMFDARARHDAERLFSDDASLNRRLRELLKHEPVSLAHQTLTSGRLLSRLYFDDQNMRVADFASNKIAVWRGVAEGNLRHLQRDVARLMRHGAAAGALDVFAGTHGVASLRTDESRVPLRLRAGRVPVPRYVWTVVVERQQRRALAVVLLNDPLVAVSEVREAVFCESACARADWLRELRRSRNYETPAFGLVFCCAVRDFAGVVPELPRDIVEHVLPGSEGMLLESLLQDSVKSVNNKLI